MTLPTFYTMIFVPSTKERIVNARESSSVDLYVKCALCLGKSLSEYGKLNVITNQETVIHELAGSTPSFSVVAHDFSLNVPAGIPFRSAHFKLDLLEAFGRGKFGENPTLLDSDIVVGGPHRTLLSAKGDICAYEITDQMVGDVGWSRMKEDLEFLMQETISVPRWYGGEWISGSVDSFRRLSERISALWPRYTENFKMLAHVGDEMLLTAALLGLEKNGIRVRDIGSDGVIRRWWSARTNFPQAPMRELKTVSFWHLPSDKGFLAGQSERTSFADRSILVDYRRHVRWKLIRRRLVNPILNTYRHENKYVGQY